MFDDSTRTPTPAPPTSATAAAGAPASDSRVRKVTVHADRTLTITMRRKKTRYRVYHVPSSPEVGHPAYRMVKLGSSEVYDVILTPFGPECTCPDYVYRRQNTEAKCKHCDVLKAIGLL